MGCERNTSKSLIHRAIGQSLNDAGFAIEAIAGLATADRKADEPALLALCHDHDWPLRTYTAPIVTIGCREQKGIAFLTFVDLLDGVTNTPVGPVHVTGNDEHHCDRHMVVGDISHPKASSYRIQPTLEGKEVAIGNQAKTAPPHPPSQKPLVKSAQPVRVNKSDGGLLTVTSEGGMWGCFPGWLYSRNSRVRI